jgi:hypothetical protein
MTRKHYQMVAEILHGDYAVHTHSPVAQNVVRGITLSLADVFAQDNPRFDRQRFYAAVGIVA